MKGITGVLNFLLLVAFVVMVSLPANANSDTLASILTVFTR